LDTVEVDALLLPVKRTEICGTLEHNVFQIVRETGIICRVVLAACLNSDLGLDSWLAFIAAEINLQSIFQGVNANIQQITRNVFVGISVAFSDLPLITWSRLT